MKLLVHVLILSFTLPLTAQVVNTEKMRSDEPPEGWVTEVNLTLGLTRNKAGQTVSLGSRGRLEHLKNKRRWLLFGSYNLTQFKDVDEPDAVPKNFANNAYGHLRYNYEISDLLTWEAFSQTQFDEVQEMQIRVLNGTGPRFKLIENEKLHLFLGALYMYEYEETTDLSELTYNRTHRLSSYASLGLQVTETFTVNHVTYFQPDLTNWQDYRISTETTLAFNITNKLSFTTYFQLVYDTRPPITVPETMYVLNNGLRLAL